VVLKRDAARYHASRLGQRQGSVSTRRRYHANSRRIAIVRTLSTGSRHLLDDSEKLERDLYRYEDSPVTSRFLVHGRFPDLLSLSPCYRFTSSHPAPEKGPSRLLSDTQLSRLQVSPTSCSRETCNTQRAKSLLEHEPMSSSYRYTKCTIHNKLTTKRIIHA
jgi:hypothetical protein